MVYGGRGMGRVDGKVIFVPYTAPGDRARVEVVRHKKDYAEATLKSLEQASLLRAEPFCNAFGRCGGCHYQHITYPAQLKLKEESLKDCLYHPVKAGSLDLLPCIPSPADRAYRIRAQLKKGKAGGREVLGFYERKSHILVEATECPLLHPLANGILKSLQRQLEKRERGFSIRGADIQVSPDEGKGLIRLWMEGSCSPRMAEILGREIPGVKGVALEGKQKITWGELTLTYHWPGILGKRALITQASYDSFSQVNPYQNWNLMRRVLELADLTGEEKVLDLYCGSGNLTLPLAQRASRVWGVDLDRRAIQNAAENATTNGLPNCVFLAASVREGIERVLGETDSINLVVLDPPRAGVIAALESLTLLRPQKILYVSCEPPTLARDLVRLRELGYVEKRVQALDMFPHTYHIEVVAEVIRGWEP